MRSKKTLLFMVLLSLLAASMMLMGARTLARRTPVQTDEKSLDVERYPNTPFEIVDISVGQQSSKPGSPPRSVIRTAGWTA
jgi:hypothetical protein